MCCSLEPAQSANFAADIDAVKNDAHGRLNHANARVDTHEIALSLASPQSGNSSGVKIFMFMPVVSRISLA